MLTQNKGRSSSGTTLLSIPVRKQSALVGDPVDVGRIITHHALVVSIDVPVADIVTPDHQDVGFILSLSWSGCPRQKNQKNENY